ncbi:hypothetical protein Bca52824_030022 [Brassica carinata]|uniref:Uncharacterized protein n=1 Tax=Brassica carinata TaxID=52824 RepID=A0A8X7V6C5_BRACI|nr:hypothetical protein Bca52824_030022 [Brassica carinata]
MDPERCIYKVSKSIRKVKPEAYRPQVVLIGLLNRCRKQKVAKDGAGTSSDPKRTNETKPKYVKMEKQKKKYLQSFKERVKPEDIEAMKKTIKDEENHIRESYYESTDWVSPESFVDHILKDSVFIMEFIITHGPNSVHDNPKQTADVKQDLMLLENQLPYFIIEKLFGSHMETLGLKETVEEFILNFFSLKIKKQTNFRHFTDMFRYRESIKRTKSKTKSQVFLNDLTGEVIQGMANADNLSRAGVTFKTPNQLLQQMTSVSIGKETDDFSLHVAFEEGVLVMSSFHADEASETILRNVIGFEQSHAAVVPFTSNYINFINFLITNGRDVEVLTAEGVIRNHMGNPNRVVRMVNDLNLGLKKPKSSQYHSIAMNLIAHYKSRRNRCWATLKKVYFPDLLTGTATFAAMFLLFLTLVGTVASVIQAWKSFESVPPTIIYMTSKADQRNDAP